MSDMCRDTALEIHEDDVLLAQDAGVQPKSIQIEEDVVGEGTRLSAADVRRNTRMEGLRELVPFENAILAIDLAEVKQHAVLLDHDSRVISRFNRIRAKAWQLGPLLDRALARAKENGFAGVTVACEPTGHRWKIIAQLAEERGMPLVCIHTVAMRRAREQEDFSGEKTDPKDTVIIGRLAGKLHCYVPERLEGGWALLRHAGTHRTQLIDEETAARQRIRDLLECGWPMAMAVAPTRDFDSPTWLACLHVALTAASTPQQVASDLTLTEFSAAVRADLPRFGGHRLWSAIVERMYAALSSEEGVRSDRAGVLCRVLWTVQSLPWIQGRLAEVEAHMVSVLDDLGLTELVSSIPALSAVGAAAILAETGDLSRFTHARAVVKHAGLAPTARASGEYTGATRITGHGRPGLRLALWRAVFGALLTNPDMKARYQHLTNRAHKPLTDGQARAALAAALLRQIYLIVTTGTPYQPHHAMPAAA